MINWNKNSLLLYYSCFAILGWKILFLSNLHSWNVNSDLDGKGWVILNISSWRTSKLIFKISHLGLSWWYSGWESVLQCREHGFDPWSRKTPQHVEQLSSCATTLDSTNCNHLAKVLQLLKPTQGEPMLHTTEATVMRILHTTTESIPTHRNERKPVHGNKDPE